MNIELYNVKKCSVCGGTNFKLAKGQNDFYIVCNHCLKETVINGYDSLWEIPEVI